MVAVRFDWSNGNEEKIAERPGITPALVESAFAYPHAVRVSDPSAVETRWRLLSVVQNRPVFIVFTIRAGRIRPISARFMNVRERRKYGPEIGYSAEVYERGRGG
jgi:uncharacterized DUF497 family protein